MLIALPAARFGERPRPHSSHRCGSTANKKEGAADIAAANKTDDEKLTEAGLVAALTVVTDIITDDMKHDLAGRLDIVACDYF